eukprot:gene1066-1209_t
MSMINIHSHQQHQHYAAATPIQQHHDQEVDASYTPIDLSASSQTLRFEPYFHANSLGFTSDSPSSMPTDSAFDQMSIASCFNLGASFIYSDYLHTSLSESQLTSATQQPQQLDNSIYQDINNFTGQLPVVDFVQQDSYSPLPLPTDVQQFYDAAAPAYATTTAVNQYSISYTYDQIVQDTSASSSPCYSPIYSDASPIIASSPVISSSPIISSPMSDVPSSPTYSDISEEPSSPATIVKSTKKSKKTVPAKKNPLTVNKTENKKTARKTDVLRSLIGRHCNEPLSVSFTVIPAYLVQNGNGAITCQVRGRHIKSNGQEVVAQNLFVVLLPVLNGDIDLENNIGNLSLDDTVSFSTTFTRNNPNVDAVAVEALVYDKSNPAGAPIARCTSSAIKFISNTKDLPPPAIKAVSVLNRTNANVDICADLDHIKRGTTNKATLFVVCVKTNKIAFIASQDDQIKSYKIDKKTKSVHQIPLAYFNGDYKLHYGYTVVSDAKITSTTFILPALQSTWSNKYPVSGQACPLPTL